jgi:hypothetical protein
MRFRFPAPSRFLAAALSAVALSAAAADQAPPGAPVKLIDADEIVYDRSQVEWSEAYLQWIATFARGNSPVSDTTGALCAAKQDGDVWFLAASDGTGPVERRCSIPAGKTLFVPLATTLERSGNKEPVCETMVRIAAGNLTHVTQLTMTIDGVAVDNMESRRIPTGDCFALGARQTPRSTARTAVADGYYVMLEPLPPGPHTIVVGARFDSTPLSTTYHLDVH